MGITPYFFNLIDPVDENGPIRRQVVVPRIEETQTAAWEMSDPCGEDSHSPVPGLVHRYPDRVLFLSHGSLRLLLPLLHTFAGSSAMPAVTISIRNTTSRSGYIG